MRLKNSLMIVSVLGAGIGLVSTANQTSAATIDGFNVPDTVSATEAPHGKEAYGTVKGGRPDEWNSRSTQLYDTRINANNGWEAFCDNYWEIGPSALYNVSNAKYGKPYALTAMQRQLASYIYSHPKYQQGGSKYGAGEVAMWIAAGNFSLNQFRPSAPNPISKADVANLLKAAKSWPVFTQKPTISKQLVSQTGNSATWKLNAQNLSGLTPGSKISWSGLPSGAKLIINGGSPQTASSGSQKVQMSSGLDGKSGTITVSVSDLTPGSHFNWNFNGSSIGTLVGANYKPLERGNTKGHGNFKGVIQNLTIAHDVSYPLSTGDSKSIDKISHTRSITWPGKSNLRVQKLTMHNKPMPGTKFSLIDQSKDDKVIGTATTGSDGWATFNDYNPDNKYSGDTVVVREDSTDNNHETTDGKHPEHEESDPFKLSSDATGGKSSVSWEDSSSNGDPASIASAEKALNEAKDEGMQKAGTQTQSIPAFHDKAIPNLPTVQSFAREPENDYGKTTNSQYIDAKNEHLHDDLQLHNLDGTCEYKVVDQLVNPDTMKPVTINGKDVSGTQTFSASGQYRKDHSDHQMTFDYPNLDFKGLKGKDYVYNVKVYDAKNGKLLTTENAGSKDSKTHSDSGQDMSDESQRIWVQSPHMKSQALAGAKDVKNGDPTNGGQASKTSGEQVVNPYSQTTLRDKVHLDGLVNNHNYTLHEHLMKVDGSSVKDTGISASKDFEADGESDDVDVDYSPFSTVNDEGDRLVVYYDLTPKKDPSDVIDQSDKKDDLNESIKVTQPSLKSTAQLDNAKESNPSHFSHLNDDVKYEGVAPGQPMTLGVQAANKDGKAVEVPGDGTKRPKENFIMGKVSFTPSSTQGDEDVPMQEVDANGAGSDTSITSSTSRTKLNKLFPITGASYAMNNNKSAQKDGSDDNGSVYDIDTTSLRGKDMVMFDDLYGASDDTAIASHADKSDADETVHVTSPKIWTKALLDDHKLSNPNTHSHLKDLIEYEDVAPNEPLNFSALAVAHNNGQPITVTDHGHKYELMGKVSTTPTSKDGSVEVPLQEVSGATSSASSKSASVSGSNKAAAPSHMDTSSPTDEGSILKRVDDNPINPSEPSGAVSPDSSSASKTSSSASSNTSKSNKSASGDSSDDNYDINTTGLAGKKMTMFEDVTSPDDNNKTGITTDANRASKDETVGITKPKLASVQKVDNNKYVSADSKHANFVDNVKYRHLAPGEKVAFNAIEMDPSTKKPEMLDGHFIWGRKTFTPRKGHGSQNVYFQTKSGVPNASWITKDFKANGKPVSPKNSLVDEQTTESAGKIIKSAKASSGYGKIPSATNKETKSNPTGKAEAPSDQVSPASGKASGKSSKAGKKADSKASKNTSDKAKSPSTAEGSKYSDTTRSAIDLSKLGEQGQPARGSDGNGGHYDWVAYDTANDTDGTPISEHKKADDANETVRIQIPKHPTKPGNNYNQNGNKPIAKSKSKSKGGNVKVNVPRSPGSTPSKPTLSKYLTGTPVGSSPSSPSGDYRPGVPALQSPVSPSSKQPYNHVPSGTSTFSGPEPQFARTGASGKMYEHAHWYTKAYKLIRKVAHMF